MVLLNNTPSISVCVITIPQRMSFFLNYCLASLTRQAIHPNQLIIIINGNNCEKEMLLLKYSLKGLVDRGVKVKIVMVQPQVPVGFCRKLAVDLSDSDYVSFIDDDVIVEKDWLSNVAKSSTYEPDILGGRVEPLDQKFWKHFMKKYSFFIEYVSVKNYLLMKFHRKISDDIYLVSGIRGLWANNLTIRKDFLKKIGNFRPLLGYLEDDVGGEDTELKHRAIKNKAKMLYNHSAIVYHKVSHSRLSIRYCFKRSWSHGLFYAIIIPLFSIIKGIVYNLLTTVWYFIVDRNKEGFLSFMRALALLSALLHYRRIDRFLDRRIERLKQVRYEVVDYV